MSNVLEPWTPLGCGVGKNTGLVLLTSKRAGLEY